MQSRKSHCEIATKKGPKTTSKNICKTSLVAKNDRRVIDGESFEVGDAVYVIIDEKVLDMDLEKLKQENRSTCRICSSEVTRYLGILVECNRCMSVHHLKCLDPPPKKPYEEWICQRCLSGTLSPVPEPDSAREIFLRRMGIGIARIDDIWYHDESNEEYFTGSWFNLPEETHVGRQHYHAAKEVFLTNHQDSIPFAAILRKVFVLNPEEFSREKAKYSSDTFLCKYTYDPVYHRFFKYGDFECDFGLEDSSSDGETFLPETNSEEDHMVIQRKVRIDSRLKKRTGPRKVQGGFKLEFQLGIKTIPEHARKHFEHDNKLRQACKALALHTMPSSLPCREKECDFIKSFMASAVNSSSGGKCLYVSGIPGTGKTATVLEAVRTLRKSTETGDFPVFQFVEINGLRLPSPHHAYSFLYESLTGEALGPNTAVRKLEKLLLCGNKCKMQHTIVLLDEMDSLINKNQNVLYNLFDWPSRSGSRLTIIGIANTMDLPQRLHPRIASRLAGEKIVFHPYSKDQLINIMEVRLKEIPIFEEKAIQYVTRKVANCSGDVRRCLELCRRAAEIAMEKNIGSNGLGLQVKITDVDAAIREAFSTPQLRLLQQSPLLSRLVLASVQLESHYAGQCEVDIKSVYDRLKELYSVMHYDKISFAMYSEIVINLISQRLLLSDNATCRILRKIALNIRPDDLVAVLKADNDLSWLDDKVRGTLVV